MTSLLTSIFRARTIQASSTLRLHSFLTVGKKTLVLGFLDIFSLIAQPYSLRRHEDVGQMLREYGKAKVTRDQT
jgi:hypothetical protein